MLQIVEDHYYQSSINSPVLCMDFYWSYSILNLIVFTYPQRGKWSGEWECWCPIQGTHLCGAVRVSDSHRQNVHHIHICQCGPPDPESAWKADLKVHHPQYLQPRSWAIVLRASVRVSEGWVRGRQAGPGARPPGDPLQTGPGWARLQGTHGPRVRDVQHGQYLLSKLDIAGTSMTNWWHISKCIISSRARIYKFLPYHDIEYAHSVDAVCVN